MRSKKWKKSRYLFRDWPSIKEFHMGSMHLASNLAVNKISRTKQSKIIENNSMPLLEEKGKREVSLSYALLNRRTSWQFNYRLDYKIFSDILLKSFAKTETVMFDRVPVELRAYPSAGALYSVDVYIWTQHMKPNMENCLWKLQISNNSLILVNYVPLSKINELTSTTKFGIQTFNKANAVIFFVSNLKVMFKKYGRLAYRLAFLESGHMCENLYLNATAYNISVAPMGGFYDHLVEDVLNITGDQICTYIVAMG